MKKKIKKIIQMITLFIIGAGGKTFASDQVQVVYGPPPREIIKENMKSNETEDYNEQEYDQSLIMYPERDSVVRIDNYMTSGPKIKKMHLKHKYRGTTK